MQISIFGRESFLGQVIDHEAVCGNPRTRCEIVPVGVPADVAIVLPKVWFDELSWHGLNDAIQLYNYHHAKFAVNARRVVFVQPDERFVRIAQANRIAKGFWQNWCDANGIELVTVRLGQIFGLHSKVKDEKEELAFTRFHYAPDQFNAPKQLQNFVHLNDAADLILMLAHAQGVHGEVSLAPILGTWGELGLQYKTDLTSVRFFEHENPNLWQSHGPSWFDPSFSSINP